MFACYNNETYLFNFYKETGIYEIVTVKAEKTDSSFEPYKSCYFKELSIEDSELSDVYDIDFWVKYRTSNETKEGWRLSRDGHCEVCEDRFVEDLGDWRRVKTICFKDVENAWTQYKYIKKDGVVLQEPLVVREDVSIEKLIETRKFYGYGYKDKL